jgi:hypothetical protein
MQFELAATYGSLDALRTYIAQQSVPKHRQMEGLRLKVFLSNKDADVFGALYLWESESAMEAMLPQLGASVRNRWGIEPRVQCFSVEAIVEGRHSTPDLSGVGQAMLGAYS